MRIRQLQARLTSNLRARGANDGNRLVVLSRWVCLIQKGFVLVLQVFNLESFTWAFGTLRSRTFAPYEGEQIALVPGLDLANHASQPLAECVQKGAGFFGAGTPTAALQSLTEIVEGEQVRALTPWAQNLCGALYPPHPSGRCLSSLRGLLPTTQIFVPHYVLVVMQV